MTHAELVARAGAWLRSRCSIVLCELKTNLPEIPDAIGWMGDGWSVLVECKASRSDFVRDSFKTPARMGQERWYLTPDGLIWPQDVGQWGLLGVRGARITRTRTPANSRLFGGSGTLDHSIAAREIPLLISALRRIQRNEDSAAVVLDQLRAVSEVA